MVLRPEGTGRFSPGFCIYLAPCLNRGRPRRRPSSSVGDRGSLQDGRRMNGESKRREFRPYHPKNGRGRRGGLGRDAKQIQGFNPGNGTPVATGPHKALLCGALWEKHPVLRVGGAVRAQFGLRPLQVGGSGRSCTHSWRQQRPISATVTGRRRLIERDTYDLLLHLLRFQLRVSTRSPFQGTDRRWRRPRELI